MGLLVLVIFTDVNMIYDYNVKIVMITVEMNVYGWIQWDFWGLALHSNLEFPCMKKKPINNFSGLGLSDKSGTALCYLVH